MNWLRMKGYKGCFCVVMICCMTVFAGCGAMNSKLEGSDWISLAYAGLESTDHYEFTGSTSIEVEGNSILKPFTFQGKVTDHNQLTVQSSSEQSQYSHPTQMMRQLKLDAGKATIIEKGVDSKTNVSTIKIKVDQQSERAKKRWEQQLKEQLQELKAALPSDSPEHTKQWQEELSRSEEQLNAMLNTLQVSSSIAVVIDTARMLPLKLNEYTEFQYERDGKPMKELRRTIVHLHSFDGRASNTMQR